jgi:hypothetical protein
MAHGGRRPGAGRKPKAKEQELIELLKDEDERVIERLKEHAVKGAPWAIKLFLQYRWGNPKTFEPVTTKERVTLGEDVRQAFDK